MPQVIVVIGAGRDGRRILDGSGAWPRSDRYGSGRRHRADSRSRCVDRVAVGSSSTAAHRRGSTFPARRLAFSDRSPPSTSPEGRGCLPSPARIQEARVLAVARPHRTRHRTPSSPRAPFERFARDVEEALVQPIALRRTVDGESRAPSPTSATAPSKTRSRRRLAPAPSSPHGLPPRADLGPTRRSRRRFAP